MTHAVVTGALLAGITVALAGPETGARERVGVNRLPAPTVAQIDALVAPKAAVCHHLALGVVLHGKVVFTKAYAAGDLEKAYEYGSVSKTVTSTIILQLRREGAIRSLDDNVWAYMPRYQGAMPEAFKDAPLTLRHLLTHRSGIPHNNEPPIVDGRFNLKFRPGSSMLYSTPGYGILGRVIEAVTGLTYSEAVSRYIGEPAGARSFQAAPSSIAPGAFVFSTIGDMARYAAAVMDRTYLPDAVLYDEALKPENGTYALGWGVANVDSPDLSAFHGGSNGLPRAHLLLKPRRRDGVALLAGLKEYAPLDLQGLADQVMAVIEQAPGGPTTR